MLYILLTRPETVPERVYAAAFLVSLAVAGLGCLLIGYVHLQEWLRCRRARHRATVALRAGVPRHLRGLPSKPTPTPYKYSIKPRSRR